VLAKVIASLGRAQNRIQEELVAMRREIEIEQAKPFLGNEIKQALESATQSDIIDLSHDNARLTAECIALVSGLSYTGSSMTEIAARHGITRAAVSKRCVELTELLDLIYINGRHTRGAGFAADLEKYLEASLAGWRVVRLGPNELTMEHIRRLVDLFSHKANY
jgi:hypothetical protein